MAQPASLAQPGQQQANPLHPHKQQRKQRQQQSRGSANLTLNNPHPMTTTIAQDMTDAESMFANMVPNPLLAELEQVFAGAAPMQPSPQYPREWRKKDWQLSLEATTKNRCAMVIYAPSPSEIQDTRDEKLRKRLMACGVPRSMAGCSLRNYDWSLLKESGDAAETVKSLIEKYAKQPYGVLLLTGQTGVGKDHLAISIMRELLARGVGEILYITPSDLANRVRRQWVPGGEPGKVIESIARTPFVVLSEMGLTDRDGEKEIVYALLDARIHAALPTVITTNLAHEPEEGKQLSPLRQYVGDRLGSRLNMAMNTLCNLRASDYRTSETGRRKYREQAMAEASKVLEVQNPN
jgi:DNA replication protein DnaC